MKQYKKLIALVLAVVMTVVLSSCETIKKYINGAEDTEVKDEGFVESKENDSFKYDIYKDYISITSYKGKDVNIIIPDKIEKKTVTTIAPLAFYNCKIQPVSITLPKTITTIKNNGFYYCEDITELVIPDSVTSIGERAFSWCSSLTNITLPKGLTELPAYAFNNCTSLQRITIPDKVTKIGMRAFSWCSSLTRVELPSSVTSIGENAFINCNLLEFAIIPKSVTEIGIGIFSNCPVLKVVADEGTTAYKYAENNSYAITTVRPADEAAPESSTAG